MLNKHLLPAALCVGATHHKRSGNMTCSSTFYRHLFSTTSVVCHTTNTELEKNNQRRVIKGLQPISAGEKLNRYSSREAAMETQCKSLAALEVFSLSPLSVPVSDLARQLRFHGFTVIHLEKLQSKVFPAGVRIEEPITVLWAVTKAVGD